MNNYKRQKFIEYIPWNDQIIYIPCISCGCCLLQILFEFDQYAFLNFITQIVWLIMLEISKKKIQKYYKAQMQEIVATVVARGDNIQQYIREFNQQQKQTYSYIQILVLVSMLQIVSMYLISNETLSNNNLLEFSTNSIMALFIYLSCKHFRAKYEITESLFPQFYVLQVTLILLSIIIANYLTTKITDQLRTISLYLVLISTAVYCCYTFFRYGLSSRKSFGYLLVGGVLIFLSQSLYGVVSVQRRELNELKGSACILYQGGYFLSYLSVLLHAKAYNDHFLLQVGMKYNI